MLETSDMYSIGDWLAYRRTFALAKSFPRGRLVTLHPEDSGFATDFDGLPLVVGGDAPLQPFTFYSFTAQASTSQSTLSFNARDDTGYYSLDDVSVLAVPEPATYALWIPLFYISVRRARS